MDGPDKSGSIAPLNSSDLPFDATRLATAIDASSDVFFDVDLADGSIKWSRGMQLLFGHDPEMLSARVDAWTDLIHPDDAAEVISSGRAFLPSGASVWTREFRLRRADGSYVPVRVRSFVTFENGHPSHVVGAITDLGDLREREYELSEVSEKLAKKLEAEHSERARADLLMRAARNEVLGQWDLRTGRITYSPNAEELFGRPLAEIDDLESFMRWTDPEEGPRQLEEIQSALASGANAWTSRPFRFRRGDGVEISLASRGYFIRDDSGTPILGVGSTVRLDGGHGAQRSLPFLTERQRRVLALIREGRTNKEIAADLGVSEQAAKAQVRKLLGKFGVANRAALAAAQSD